VREDVKKKDEGSQRTADTSGPNTQEEAAAGVRMSKQELGPWPCEQNTLTASISVLCPDFP